MTDLDALEAAAKAASTDSQPWPTADDLDDPFTYFTTPRDRALIAAADPQTVLALVAIARVAQEAELVLGTLNRQALDGGGERGQVYMTVEAWRAAVQPVLDRLRDALRMAGLE